MKTQHGLMRTHELEHYSHELEQNDVYPNIVVCLNHCKRTKMFTNVLHRGNLQLLLENPTKENIDLFKTIYPLN